jgi:cytochrome c oxidase assembly protein subunit 15
MERAANRGKLWYSATILLALQMLLVVTGGLVRVTGSGLGCPTWPKCTGESFVPDKTSSHIHGIIEFGNRMLTFALVAAAATTLVLAWRRSDLRKLAWLQFLGIFGQGILGGITVLTKLHPATVASHLLLSMLLIAGASTLQFKVRDYLENSKENNNPQYLVANLLVVFAFITLIAGTIVTGSGPHAGDWQAPRFHFNLYTVAHIHSIFVASTFALALYIAIKFPRVQANFLIGIMICQGLIGIIQWRLGLPQALVGIHLLGSALFWFAVWRTRLSFKFTGLKDQHQ